jgi:hypothetical protein
VVEENHVELEGFWHIERLSKVSQTGCRAAGDNLNLSCVLSRCEDH